MAAFAPTVLPFALVSRLLTVRPSLVNVGEPCHQSSRHPSTLSKFMSGSASHVVSDNAGTVGVVPYLAVPDVMVRPRQSLNSVLYVFASHWAYRVRVCPSAGYWIFSPAW